MTFLPPECLTPHTFGLAGYSADPLDVVSAFLSVGMPNTLQSELAPLAACLELTNPLILRLSVMDRFA